MSKLSVHDSAHKIIHHIGQTCRDDIYYDGELINNNTPHKLKISQTFFRKFICVKDCVACCLNFSLDFIPKEFDNLTSEQREYFKERNITVNGVTRAIYTLPDNRRGKDIRCEFLTEIDSEEGKFKGCGLFTEMMPLSCEMSPQIQFLYRSDYQHTYLMKKSFGRGWQFGAECEFKEKNDVDYERDLDLLWRLQWWGDYFELNHNIGSFIDTINKLKSLNKRETVSVEMRR